MMLPIGLPIKRTTHGWLNMLSKGATTFMGNMAISRNGSIPQTIPCFGSIDEWFYRSLLGINPGAPVLKQLLYKQQPVKELTWAKGAYHSIKEQ
jgi:alpha-L-rhamnosidase